MLVDLVNRLVERPELDDFARELCQEAPVRRPAACRKRRLHAHDRVHRRGERLHERTPLCEKRFADQRPLELGLQTMAIENSDTRACSAGADDSDEKRKLNETSSVPGMMLLAPVPAWIFEIWKLVG